MVYGIPKGCDKSYIGETGRLFGTRLKEHRKDSESIKDTVFTRANRNASTSEQHKSHRTGKPHHRLGGYFNSRQRFQLHYDEAHKRGDSHT